MHLNSFILPLLALSASAAFLSGNITVPMTDIGNPGNPADSTATGNWGAVSYSYRISTYEITNSQYAAFLNAVAATDTHGLHDNRMNSTTNGGITQNGTSGSFSYTVNSGFANKPVNYVTFWDAARFANWMTNGQPTGSQGLGTTEDGMYFLNGATTPPDPSTVTRNTSAFQAGGYAIPSEDEWHKAAFYDPSNGYWDYATQSNIAPNAIGPNNTDPNSANYAGAVGTLTDFGAYALASSFYGTFDQNGNVWEWMDNPTGGTGTARAWRGGGFLATTDATDLVAGTRFPLSTTVASENGGFRLVTVPEPSVYAAILGAAGLMLVMVRRRTRR